MRDGQAAVAAVVGGVEWVSAVEGYCRCPGEARHTTRAGKKDCRVRLDGVPTFFCFHSNCAGEVEEANGRLRRELGKEEWSLKLPDGRTVTSGELAVAGVVVPRMSRGRVVRERQIEGLMSEKLPEILDEMEWPYEVIVGESRVATGGMSGVEMFRRWLGLWPVEANIWVGDKMDSGRPEHVSNFRYAGSWASVSGAVPGPLTTGAAFKHGSFSRSQANVHGYVFMVVESDVLSRDEVGAVFRWMRRKLRYELVAVVDTGGKSLHGWFRAPPAEHIWKMRAALKGLRCDPKTINAAQPVRVPGAVRPESGRVQRLLWIER